ncbi:hypothetical protein [Sulfitobacter sp. R18_1]|uniref:hypothetical protein n=1 Tax=Sulfitobacter sp. R18_1 TaxID=2821104 RepID=UPI001AD97D3B|nr:hypothetical protein [Sulfitobacter sp. R18_1]MBO9428212.1 hypothetical protein [Sulfitobacter sp. R18_1]
MRSDDNQDDLKPDYIRGKLAAIDSHLASIALSDRNAGRYLIASFLGFTAVLGFGVYQSGNIEEVVSSAKKEVREIAGTIHPDHVGFGRIEPGDSRKLVFFLSIYRSRPNAESWRVQLETSPYVEVEGNRGSFIGWRFSLEGELLDWITGSNTFKSGPMRPGEEKYLGYQRADWAFGRVSLHNFGEDNPITVTLIPGNPYSNTLTLHKPYATCEEAIHVAEILMEADFYGTGVNGIHLAPLVIQYPVEGKRFRAEIVPIGDYEGLCSEEPSDASKKIDEADHI